MPIQTTNLYGRESLPALKLMIANLKATAVLIEGTGAENLKGLVSVEKFVAREDVKGSQAFADWCNANNVMGIYAKMVSRPTVTAQAQSIVEKTTTEIKIANKPNSNSPLLSDKDALVVGLSTIYDPTLGSSLGSFLGDSFLRDYREYADSRDRIHNEFMLSIKGQWGFVHFNPEGRVVFGMAHQLDSEHGFNEKLFVNSFAKMLINAKACFKVERIILKGLAASQIDLLKKFFKNEDLHSFVKNKFYWDSPSGLVNLFEYFGVEPRYILSCGFENKLLPMAGLNEDVVIRPSQPLNLNKLGKKVLFEDHWKDDHRFNDIKKHIINNIQEADEWIFIEGVDKEFSDYYKSYNFFGKQYAPILQKMNQQVINDPNIVEVGGFFSMFYDGVYWTVSKDVVRQVPLDWGMTDRIRRGEKLQDHWTVELKVIRVWLEQLNKNSNMKVVVRTNHWMKLGKIRRGELNEGTGLKELLVEAGDRIRFLPNDAWWQGHDALRWTTEINDYERGQDQKIQQVFTIGRKSDFDSDWEDYLSHWRGEIIRKWAVSEWEEKFIFNH